MKFTFNVNFEQFNVYITCFNLYAISSVVDEKLQHETNTLTFVSTSLR